MAISLRLDRKLESELNRYARMAGKPKSEIIRKLIADFIEASSKIPTPWEAGKDLFGREGSGRGNLAIDRKAILKEKLHAKKNRH